MELRHWKHMRERTTYRTSVPYVALAPPSLRLRATARMKVEGDGEDELLLVKRRE
jgi:hypothetical protein